MSVDMTDERERLAAARAELKEATTVARKAANRAIKKGVSESETARQLGVTRITVRAWIGKV